MEKRPEHTRQVLIRAAAELIANGRFADAGLVNICRAAGVSRGALYHHFGSVAELVSEVYDRALVRIDELADEAFGGPPAEAPAEFSIALGAALLEEELVRAGIQIGADGTAEPPRLRELTLTRLRERMTEGAREGAGKGGAGDGGAGQGAGAGADADRLADLAVVVTAGLESLGHADPYWWSPGAAKQIWGMVEPLFAEEGRVLPQPPQP
ncbi:TetR/AcrR family transcriptional regulator [Streptomyces sp. B-S-A8]|uniref:TetR/AcrR family transcriptional regulator n=1 Tax=Streptomyces solicavernae TaxID=3043614 RepID=A0ABT6S1S7_9ACTN|nr:TetR/AcrR family transcriptional regulator [Streptomyces sp. B-S-A8]MDI3390399.1 TetR/AcrR family transcriptional regulator [Streptomyces sp. B-S-A8]